MVKKNHVTWNMMLCVAWPKKEMQGHEEKNSKDAKDHATRCMAKASHLLHSATLGKVNIFISTQEFKQSKWVPSFLGNLVKCCQGRRDSFGAFLDYLKKPKKENNSRFVFETWVNLTICKKTVLECWRFIKFEKTNSEFHGTHGSNLIMENKTKIYFFMYVEEYKEEKNWNLSLDHIFFKTSIRFINLHSHRRI